MTTYLTIDPGIGGTGWAMWTEEWVLIHAGVVTARKTSEWDCKMMYIAGILEERVKAFNIERIYVEYPQKFGGAGGDMVANKGDLGKLFTFVGYICGYLESDSFELVPVIKWKGQLPKKIVNKRIARILKPKELKLMSKNQSHDWDAVGIGLYIQGLL